MRKIFFIFIFLVFVNPVSAQHAGEIILQTEIPIPGEIPADYVPVDPEPEPAYVPRLVELKKTKAEKVILGEVLQRRSQFTSENKTALEYNYAIMTAMNDFGAWADKNPRHGETVRQMLKYQSDIADKIIPNYSAVLSHGKIWKFFWGADYGKITELQKNLNKAKRNFNEFEFFKEKLRLNEDWELFNKNSVNLKNSFQNISDNLDKEWQRFSVFGWLLRIFY